jgi:ATP-binding cassette subfamily B protein
MGTDPVTSSGERAVPGVAAAGATGSLYFRGVAAIGQALGGVRARLTSSARLELLRQLPRAAPGLTAAVAVLTVVEALVPSARAVASGAVVGAIAGLRSGAPDATAGQLWTGLAATAVAVVLQMALAPWRATAADAISRRFMRVTLERMMRAMLRPATIAHLEDPAVQDQLERARNTGFVGPRVAANSLLAQIGTRGRGVVALGLFATFDWRVALALLVVLQWRNQRLAGLYRQILPVMWGKTESLRRADYLRNLAMGAGAAKELRVFGLADWTVGRLRHAWLGAMEPIWRDRGHAGRRLLLGNVPALLAAVLAFGLLARAGLQGDVGIGALVTYVQALFVVFNNLGGSGGDPYEDGRVVYGAAGLRPLNELESATASARLRLGGTRPADGLPAGELRFEGVSFRYGEDGRDVLRGLDLAIPAGRSLAIVGENGSGKTTLIKLLARLYDPTEGRILVDGIDLRELDARSWQRRIAAIFQDFCRHALSAADNVAFGAIERADDRAALASAAGRAGALELIERLPRGWDTILSRQYSGGVQLSGGEWQRVALARALFAAAAGAGVLVLDEPTAHLDVRAEAAFYDNFLDLTRGCTAIVISHRFSTVRRADRIAVLDGGAVVEQGSHDELVAANGRYAAAFRLQAARFVEGNGHA